MRYPFTKAYSQYGANMGRRDYTEESGTVNKLHLQKVPLDSGGYDPGGAYWGIGKPLYVAYGDGETLCQEIFIRADSRDHAKEQARKTFPNATFYR